MKKLFVFVALCFLGFSAWAQGADTKVAVDAVNGLSVDLYKKLASQEKGNLFFSPYSISDALAMTYGGARGATAAEMAKTLYFPAEQLTLHKSFSEFNNNLEAIQKKGDIKIDTANAVWLQSDFANDPVWGYFKCKADYLQSLKDYYKSGLNQVDYRDTSKSAFIRDTINAWVEQKTNNKIKNLIPLDVPDQDTRLILVNAIYFKGTWQDEFNKKNTKPMPFYLHDNETKEAQMMYQRASFQYAEDKDVQVLTMPYEGYDLSMTIILPKEKNGLAAVENGLTTEKLSKMVNIRICEVDVYLPKFKLESEFTLNDTLKKMGMPLAFDGNNADFSGMADFPPGYHLYISKVIHKAFVDVYEEGTEAAAATMVSVNSSSSASFDEPKIFRADHPFIFLIKDNKTGAILFLGRYVKPESK
jgi:serpin B